ncbi:unnamed protein product, partial [Larinioides sclopetarius]
MVSASDSGSQAAKSSECRSLSRGPPQAESTSICCCCSSSSRCGMGSSQTPQSSSVPCLCCSSREGRNRH